jgi:hypothetical protein
MGIRVPLRSTLNCISQPVLNLRSHFNIDLDAMQLRSVISRAIGSTRARISPLAVIEPR